jgi:hypothetical protein
VRDSSDMDHLGSVSKIVAKTVMIAVIFSKLTSVFFSGILREDEYDSSQVIGSGFSGETRVNGSGSF